MADKMKIKKSHLKTFVLIMVVFILGVTIENNMNLISKDGSTDKMTFFAITHDNCDLCNSQQVIEVTEQLFDDISVKEISYSSSQGKTIVDSLGLTKFPVYVFTKDIQNQTNFTQVQNALVEKDDYYYIRPEATGSTFDMTKESECADGKDDDGDGLIDCDDPDCSNNFNCMQKQDVPTVDLFVMSYCPYGTQTQKAMLPVVDLLQDKIDFNLRFVHYIMHGEEEREENLRQYCIQENQEEKLVDYLYCFLEDGNSTRCIQETNLDQSSLETCMENTDTGEGTAFTLDAELSQQYGIGGSPGLVVNGITAPSVPRNPAGLLDVVCNAFTEKPDECNEQLSSTNQKTMFGFDGSSTGSGSC